jgi:hypothetical protein
MIFYRTSHDFVGKLFNTFRQFFQSITSILRALQGFLKAFLRKALSVSKKALFPVREVHEFSYTPTYRVWLSKSKFPLQVYCKSIPCKASFVTEKEQHTKGGE